jgi:hypothetical protein
MVEVILRGVGEVLEGRGTWRGLLAGFVEEQGRRGRR